MDGEYEKTQEKEQKKPAKKEIRRPKMCATCGCRDKKKKKK